MARAWLPEAAFSASAVGKALAGAVDEWLAYWIGGGRAEISLSEPALPEQGECLRHDAFGGEIGLAPPCKRALIEAVLVVDLATVSLNDADRVVLDHLAGSAARDLLGRLRIARSADAEPPITASIACRERTLLTLTVPRSGIAELIVGAGARRRGSPLISRSRALGATRVTVEGLLGRGALTLRELDGLAVGDVVVLDRASSDRADLRLVGRSTPIAAGILGRDGDHPSVRLAG